MDKDHKKKLLTDGLPMVVAVVALLVSFRSCSTSDEAVQMAKVDFRSSRALVLTGDCPDKSDEIIFKPLSDEMSIVTLTVHDPSRLLDNGVEFTSPWSPETDPPGTWRYLNGAKKVITDYHLDTSCKGQPGNVMVIARLPVIVQTSYLVKGTRLEDTSIYSLKYVFYREGDQEVNTKLTRVMFRNVEFSSRLAPQDAERMMEGLADGKPLVIRFEGESNALDEK